MNNTKEKIDAQKKLANIFFEMGLEEDVVSTITGLQKEETSLILKKRKEKDKKGIDIKK